MHVVSRFSFEKNGVLSSTTVLTLTRILSLAVQITISATVDSIGGQSVGHYLNPYSVLDLYENDLGDVKFIRVGGSDSIIDVTYFGV